MKALVLAGGLPQIKLTNDLKERGIEVVLADGNAKPLAYGYADIFYQVNIFDVEAVKDIAVKEKVDFLITCCADQVLLVVAQISEMLGLPWYIDYNTAKQVSDKELMKEMFVECGIPTSKHVVMKSFDSSLLKDLNYPLIVKPVDSYSSRGVRKVVDEHSLRKAFEEALAISRTSGVIVEELCLGEEISVDVFVTDGKAKLLCVSNSEKIKSEDRFVIFRGKWPVNISEEVYTKIEIVAQQIADGFKIKNAPMLIQLISDGKDISVLEFCARTGGAMKYILINRSCGVDVIDAVIDLSLGLEPDTTMKPPKAKYIVNDFIYCNAGEFDHLEGFQELVDSGVLAEYHPLRPKGFIFSGSANSSGDRAAGMTIQADSKEEFNEKYKVILDKIKVIDKDGKDIIRKELLRGI